MRTGTTERYVREWLATRRPAATAGEAQLGIVLREVTHVRRAADTPVNLILQARP
jgi:hypothetical protein